MSKCKTIYNATEYAPHESLLCSPPGLSNIKKIKILLDFT